MLKAGLACAVICLSPMSAGAVATVDAPDGRQRAGDGGPALTVLAAQIHHFVKPTIKKPILPKKKNFGAVGGNTTVRGMDEVPTGDEDAPQRPSGGGGGGGTTHDGGGTPKGGGNAGDCYITHMDEVPTGCE